MEPIKAKVIIDHKAINTIFPKGFETTAEKRYYEEDLVSEGFYTKLNNQNVWVGKKVIKKGTFKDIMFKGQNGTLYSSDWFHKMTGKVITEIMKRI